MKGNRLTRYVAINADQRNSRHGADLVPGALRRLASIDGLALPFERTAGDEIQTLTATPEAVVTIILELTRLGGWRIGCGIGTVEQPLPASTREARGAAYLSAREAIETAHRSPSGLAVKAEFDVSDVESALWLLRSVAGRRTDEGWALADLLGQGLTQAEIADRLQISRSAVSQRASRASIIEVNAGQRLATRLLRRALDENAGAHG